MARRKDYKENITKTKMKKSVRFRGYNRKGQVAIFIIVAIVIAAVIIGVIFYPRLKFSAQEAFNPERYMRDCIEPGIKPVMEKLNAQGGYMNPEGFILMNDVKVKYLCYTSEFYKTCMVQQPALVSHYEQELQKEISPRVKQCFSNLKDEYERQGYSVSAGQEKVSLEIVPQAVKINVVAPMTVTKDVSQTFNELNIKIDSEMYLLLSTAVSIIDFESVYGDSETTLYIRYYPDLKIEKSKLSDGSKIYRVSNVVSNENFTFASRSLSWPPGYGLE